MKTLEELKKAYAAKIAEAKKKTEVAGDQPLSKEAADEITALLGGADEIKVQIDHQERIQAADAYLDQPAGTKAAHHGWRPAGPGEGDPDVDVKAWHSFKIALLTPFGVEKKEIRYHVPMAVQMKGYASAFEAYIRKGKGDLPPYPLSPSCYKSDPFVHS